MERISARSVLTRGTLVVALFVGLGFLALQVVPGAGERLANASAGWIAVGVALELIACAGFVACFNACFSYGNHLVTLSRSAQVALGELAAFAVVPTGVAAPLLRFWALNRGGMPLRTIGVRTVVHAVLLNAAYVSVALVLGIGVLADLVPGESPTVVALAPAGLVLVACALGLLVTRLGRSPRLQGRGGWRAVVRELATIVPEALREIPRRARNPWAIGGGAIYWACDCAVLWAAFQSVGVSPGVALIAIAYMLGQLGNTLPLPGGVGGVEPIMAEVLHSSGIDLGVATAAIIIYRAISLGLQATMGAVAIGLLIPSVRAEARR